MAPKATPKPDSTLKAARGGRGGGRGGRGARQIATPKQKKFDNVDDDFSAEEQDELEQEQTPKNKKMTNKKPASDDDDDEEDLDEEEDEEDLDDEDEEDEEDEDEEDFDEDEANDSKSGSSGGRTLRTLFIKNLPESTTVEQIKALSPDIQQVRIDVSHAKGEKNPKYAILDFADGETAAKTLALLKGQPINGADVVVDFIGGKSSVSYAQPAPGANNDPLKLYVTGFGRDITMDQLKNMFPESADITLPPNPKDDNKPLGYAFIHYEDEDVAKAAHDAMQDHVYQSRTLVVMYAKKASAAVAGGAKGALAGKGGDKRKVDPPKRGRSKKAKIEEEEEEEDEEEEEEEEEDEEDN